MPKEGVVDLIVEDKAQEAFLGALVRRLGHEQNAELAVRAISVTGGRPAVAGNLKVYHKLQKYGQREPASFVVVGNDGNCTGWNARKKEIEGWRREEALFETVAVCPEPHIERWFFLDLKAFHKTVAPCDAPPKAKCDKGFYKEFLRNAVAPSGSLLGGIEFARDIVEGMDINVARTADASFNDAVENLRAAIRKFVAAEGK